jgi:hypothetical protein
VKSFTTTERCPDCYNATLVVAWLDLELDRPDAPPWRLNEYCTSSLCVASPFSSATG